MKNPLVEVTWKDAAYYSRGSWMADPKDARPIEAKTVGYLLRRTRIEIAIAQTRSDETDQWGGIWVIPKGWVTKIKRLK